jgi:hypothetical protein
MPEEHRCKHAKCSLWCCPGDVPENQQERQLPEALKASAYLKADIGERPVVADKRP